MGFVLVIALYMFGVQMLALSLLLFQFQLNQFQSQTLYRSRRWQKWH